MKIFLLGLVFGTCFQSFGAPPLTNFPTVPEKMGAGISTRTEDGAIKYAEGPQGCLVTVNGTQVKLLTVPADFSPFPNSIDIQVAHVSSPEDGLTIFSISPNDDLCVSPLPGQTGTMQSGTQTLIVESNMKAPVMTLVTKISCQISGKSVEKTFRRKCDLNFTFDQ